MKKTRNNSLRVKKSLEKAASKIKHFNKVFREEKDRQSKKFEENQILLREERKRKETEQQGKLLLANLDKMSYNEARKLASSLGISVYQRKKEAIIKDLRQHYEQLETTH
jgi:hypothetical protein